jgi:RNA polymerase sigma-70 factor (ECF subfamily)
MDTPITLLARLQQPGDAAAWERFVGLYTPVLFAWAHQLGLSDSDAAALIQEVFVLLLEKLPRFRYEGSKSFRAWLKTVTLNKYRETRRRRIPHQVADGELDAIPAQAEAFWEADYRKHLTERALEVMQAEFSRRPGALSGSWSSPDARGPMLRTSWGSVLTRRTSRAHECCGASARN